MRYYYYPGRADVTTAHTDHEVRLSQCGVSAARRDRPAATTPRPRLRRPHDRPRATRTPSATNAPGGTSGDQPTATRQFTLTPRPIATAAAGSTFTPPPPAPATATPIGAAVVSTPTGGPQPPTVAPARTSRPQTVPTPLPPAAPTALRGIPFPGGRRDEHSSVGGRSHAHRHAAAAGLCGRDRPAGARHAGPGRSRSHTRAGRSGGAQHRLDLLAGRRSDLVGRGDRRWCSAVFAIAEVVAGHDRTCFHEPL